MKIIRTVVKQVAIAAVMVLGQRIVSRVVSKFAAKSKQPSPAAK